MRARHRARGGRSTARSPRKPLPAPTWRPDPGRRQPTLFEKIPRDYSRLALAGADLADPWPAGAKHLALREPKGGQQHRPAPRPVGVIARHQQRGRPPGPAKQPWPSHPC
ncbi:hypothetical protein [Streptomyces sp. NPDC056244]|uniref:hypothetical protein n=1 Tax=Streptomyces sp. NPDC056244 TaxID=3345762 RepID=UPI0035E28C43